MIESESTIVQLPTVEGNPGKAIVVHSINATKRREKIRGSERPKKNENVTTFNNLDQMEKYHKLRYVQPTLKLEGLEGSSMDMMKIVMTQCDWQYEELVFRVTYMTETIEITSAVELVTTIYNGCIDEKKTESQQLVRKENLTEQDRSRLKALENSIQALEEAKTKITTNDEALSKLFVVNLTNEEGQSTRINMGKLKRHTIKSFEKGEGQIYIEPEESFVPVGSKRAVIELPNGFQEDDIEYPKRSHGKRANYTRHIEEILDRFPPKHIQEALDLFKMTMETVEYQDSFYKIFGPPQQF